MDRPFNHGHAAERLDERRAEGAEWRRQVPHVHTAFPLRDLPRETFPT